MNILIFGAGSVGTHHTHAARALKYNAYITDVNENQLEFMKSQLYPKRYGKWDKKIKIIKFKNIFITKIKFDLIIIGVTPINHLFLLKKCIKKLKFDKILVEKPLCVFNQPCSNLLKLKQLNKIYCGFNHTISSSVQYILKYIKNKKIKDIKLIEINWKEDFDLLLKAHPWIKSLNQTYLSDYKKGGGVLHEFSHAIHLAYTIKKIVLGRKKIQLNSLVLFNQAVRKYDHISFIILKSDKTNINVNINGISNPPEKNLKIYGKNVKIVWERIENKNIENVKIIKNNKEKNIKFKISRPQDFINQMKILTNKNSNHKLKNFNKLDSGIEVMKIIRKCM